MRSRLADRRRRTKRVEPLPEEPAVLMQTRLQVSGSVTFVLTVLCFAWSLAWLDERLGWPAELVSTRRFDESAVGRPMGAFREATRLAPSLSLQLTPTVAATFGESELLLRRRIRLQVYRARVGGPLHEPPREPSAFARQPGAPGGWIEWLLLQLTRWHQMTVGGGALRSACGILEERLDSLPLEELSEGLSGTGERGWLCGAEPSPPRHDEPGAHTHSEPERIVDVTTELSFTCRDQACTLLPLAYLRGLPRHDYAFRVTLLPEPVDRLARRTLSEGGDAGGAEGAGLEGAGNASGVAGSAVGRVGMGERWPGDAESGVSGFLQSAPVALPARPPDQARPDALHAIDSAPFAARPPAPVGSSFPPAPPWLPGGADPLVGATLLLSEASEASVLRDVLTRCVLSAAALLALRAIRLRLRGFLSSDHLPEQRTLLPVTLAAALHALPLAPVLQLSHGGPLPAAAAAAAALLFHSALLLFVLVAADAARHDPAAADAAAAWLPRAIFFAVAVAPPLLLLIDDAAGGGMRLGYLAEPGALVAPGFTMPLPARRLWRGDPASASLLVLFAAAAAVGVVGAGWLLGLVLAFLLEPDAAPPAAAGPSGKRWRLFLSLLLLAPLLCAVAAADAADALCIPSQAAIPAMSVRLVAAVGAWLLLAYGACPAAGMRFLTMRSLRLGAEQALRAAAVRALGREGGAPNELSHSLFAKKEPRMLRAVRALQMYAPGEARDEPHSEPKKPCPLPPPGVPEGGVAWLQSHMSTRLDFTPPWAHAALYGIALGVALTSAFYGVETAYVPGEPPQPGSRVSPQSGSKVSPQSGAFPEWPPWLSDYVPRSTLVSTVNAVAGQGCASPTDRFDPLHCGGVDVLRGAPVLVPAPAASARQHGLTIFLRAFNRRHRVAGIVRRLWVDVQMVAWLSVNGSSGEWVAVRQPVQSAVAVRCEPYRVACEPIAIHHDEGFPRAVTHGWRPPSGLGAWAAAARDLAGAQWEGVVGAVVAPPAQRRHLAANVSIPLPVQITPPATPAPSEPALPSVPPEQRPGTPASPLYPPAPPLRPPASPAGAPGLADTPIAYRVSLLLSEPRLPPRVLGDPPKYDLRYEPVGDVALWSRRDTVGCAQLRMHAQLGCAVVAACLLLGFLYGRRGAGRRTPQQRALPWALAAVVVLDCGGPQAPLMLLAPEAWDAPFARAGAGCVGCCHALLLLYTLTSLHAFAHDDLTPHSDGRWTKRTFGAFWLPKLLLAATLGLLSTTLALDGLAAWPVPRAWVQIGYWLAVGIGSAYFVVLLAWVALRTPTEPLRDGRRSHFLVEGAVAAVVLTSLAGLELVSSGIGREESAAAAELLPPLVASGLSAADAGALVDAIAVGARVLQLLLLNLYSAAQAFLFTPSAAMRALRADAARGVDTQLRALGALLPEVARRMEGEVRRGAESDGAVPLAALVARGDAATTLDALLCGTPRQATRTTEVEMLQRSPGAPRAPSRFTSYGTLPTRPSIPPPEPPVEQPSAQTPRAPPAPCDARPLRRFFSSFLQTERPPPANPETPPRPPPPVETPGINFPARLSAAPTPAAPAPAQAVVPPAARVADVVRPAPSLPPDRPPPPPSPLAALPRGLPTSARGGGARWSRCGLEGAPDVRALLSAMDASLDAAQLSVVDVQRRASPLRAAVIAEQAIAAASGLGGLGRLSGNSACSATSSQCVQAEAPTDSAPAAVLTAGVAVPARELPIGLVDEYLGEQMMHAQLRERCEAALRDVCAATLRLRETRRRRTTGGLRAEYEALGAAGRRAVDAAAPQLRLAARMLECRPLPLCAPSAVDGWSADEAAAARSRLAMHAMADEWGAEVEPLLRLIGAWVRSTRQHDLAGLGFVSYDALPPPRLAPREQRAWRTLCESAADRLSRAQAAEVRAFLASRPELVGLVDTVREAEDHSAALSRPLRFTYALLLKDMAGYTIKGVAPAAPWKSAEATLSRASVLTEPSHPGRRTAGDLASPPPLSHPASWGVVAAAAWDELSCVMPAGGFEVDFGSAGAWGGRPGRREADALVHDTYAQLQLRIWLHGALTRSGDTSDTIAWLRRLRGQASEPAGTGWGSRRYSRLGDETPWASDRRKYERELFRVRAQAQHAIVLSVLTGGGLTSEEELCTARWLPPWRDPGSLVEAVEEEAEAAAAAARDEAPAGGMAGFAEALGGGEREPAEARLAAAQERLYRRWVEEAQVSGEAQQTLPLFDGKGNEVGSVVVEVRAAAAFAEVCRQLDAEEMEEEPGGQGAEEGGEEGGCDDPVAEDACVAPPPVDHTSAAPSFWQSLSFLPRTAHEPPHTARTRTAADRWKRAESLSNLLSARLGGPARQPRRYARYLLTTDERQWDATLDALEAALSEPGRRALPPRWLTELRSKVGSRRERPQPVMVLRLDVDKEAAVRQALRTLGGPAGRREPRLMRAAELTLRVVSVRTNARFHELHRARWLTSPVRGRNRVRVRVTATLHEHPGSADRLKVFSPDSASQLLEMVTLRDSDHVGRIVARLGAAGFDTSLLKVNAQELPLVRTPSEDASAGKQLLVLLSLRPEVLKAQAKAVRQERFEREGDPTLLETAEPTPAEAVQIIDRLLRLPMRYGGAELRSPHDARYASLGREAGYPPPSWRVGGVELIEASYPVHDWDLNRRMEASLFWDHFFLSDAQLSRLRAHHGEEVAFYFAFCDLSNRALLPVAMVGPVVLAVRNIARSSGSRVYAVLEPFYAAALVLWGTYLLMLWRRRRAELQVAWGVEHFEGRSFERPQFHCWHNASTGEPRYYPEWRRTAKRALSLLATLLQTVLLIFLTILIYLHYVNAVEYYTGIQKTLIASALNGLMYGLIIMGLELLLFGAISRVLTEFENYRTQSEFESAYVFKMFFFVWVDGYLWYWILGLVHIPIVREHSGPDGRIDPAFARQTTIFGWRVFNEGTTTVDQWIHSFETSVTFQVAGSNTLILALENLLPVLWVWWVRSRWNAHIRRARRSLNWPLLRRVIPTAGRGGANGKGAGGTGGAGEAAVWDTLLQLREVLWEGNRAPYDVFWDMYDAVLYLGYVSVLSLQQPLFPLIVFINNMIEIRTDLTKIGTCQRPLPRTTKDLGEWEGCLWFQNFLAVLQVSLFIVFSTEALETVWFTDSSNPHYFVDGRLTVYVRLSVAFGFCVLLLGAIFVIRNTMGELPRDAGLQRLRRMRLHSTLKDRRLSRTRSAHSVNSGLSSVKEKAA